MAGLSNWWYGTDVPVPSQESEENDKSILKNLKL